MSDLFNKSLLSIVGIFPFKPDSEKHSWQMFKNCPVRLSFRQASKSVNRASQHSQCMVGCPSCFYRLVAPFKGLPALFYHSTNMDTTKPIQKQTKLQNANKNKVSYSEKITKLSINENSPMLGCRPSLGNYPPIIPFHHRLRA